ncbi:hypothetical protein K435DRAFT_826619 [Dendrothele bispora CBS 962.96]|uniref:N-acetyltransferase domain-containing protein n=1 Tax=Dendrothele bispora (strain CBS 962.96) TaxID=1314807 RepID=A0A4S8MQ32_DENBC|nr:hypothetical protein K435DRAFT_826619 [Dendrothele bispora CBS 962.96]
MAAYGAFTRSSGNYQPGTVLPSTVWCSRPTATPSDPSIDASKNPYVTIHHLTLSTAKVLPGLITYLSSVFAGVVEEGRTYPQEDAITESSFEKYFFAEDVFIAIQAIGSIHADQDTCVTNLTLEEARNKREWEDCVVGYYYIKPNYPGRSSHICNGGFVVPPNHRKGGHGSNLARSFLFYAPGLGYRASVFNLVYVNNEASVRLWERLGFTKIGRIPQAGRLKRLDGRGEEYVDAWVIYKSFVNAEEEQEELN